MAADVVEKAHRVTGSVQAARMRDRLFSELMSPALPPEREEEIGEAVEVLESNFPGIKDVTDVEAYAMSRGAGAKGRKVNGTRIVDDGKRDGAAGEKAAQAASKAAGARPSGRKRGRQSGASASPSRRRSAPARGRARAQGRRALEQTGLPRAGRSATQLVMQGAGLTIGLSLLYLLLNNGQRAGRGDALLEVIGNAVTGLANGLIRPVDPFAGAAGMKAKEIAGPLGTVSGAGIAVGSVAAGAGEVIGDTSSGIGASAGGRPHNGRRRRQGNRRPIGAPAGARNV